MLPRLCATTTRSWWPSATARSIAPATSFCTAGADAVVLEVVGDVAQELLDDELRGPGLLGEELQRLADDPRLEQVGPAGLGARGACPFHRDDRGRRARGRCGRAGATGGSPAPRPPPGSGRRGCGSPSSEPRPGPTPGPGRARPPARAPRSGRPAGCRRTGSRRVGRSGGMTGEGEAAGQAAQPLPLAALHVRGDGGGRPVGHRPPSPGTVRGRAAARSSVSSVAGAARRSSAAASLPSAALEDARSGRPRSPRCGCPCSRPTPAPTRACRR